MYNAEKILLIDDEPGLLKMLKITLQRERYKNIACAKTATHAMNLIKENKYDLIILDVMLPDFSGFDLCTKIRKITYTPIIFLSACDSDYNKLTGLAIGGDDYITKPFNPLEVVARVKTILRRQQYALSQASSELNTAAQAKAVTSEFCLISFAITSEIWSNLMCQLPCFSSINELSVRSSMSDTLKITVTSRTEIMIHKSVI